MAGSRNSWDTGPISRNHGSVACDYFWTKRKRTPPEVPSYVLKDYGLGILTRPERAAILPQIPKSRGDNNWWTTNREKVSEETKSITSEQQLSPKAGEVEDSLKHSAQHLFGEPCTVTGNWSLASYSGAWVRSRLHPSLGAPILRSVWGKPELLCKGEVFPISQAVGCREKAQRDFRPLGKRSFLLHHWGRGAA